MATEKPIGYIKNLANPSMVHLVYSGARLSFAFPIGHVLELIVDGGCPHKELTEKDLSSLCEPEKVVEPEEVVNTMASEKLSGELGFLRAREEPEAWEACDCLVAQGDSWAEYDVWKNWQYSLLIDDDTKWRRNYEKILSALGTSIVRGNDGHPVSWSIRLNEYQRSNLLWLLCDVVGYGKAPGLVSGLHTGDWVGEIANLLRLNEKGEMEESVNIPNGKANPVAIRIVGNEPVYQGVG